MILNHSSLSFSGLDNHEEKTISALMNRLEGYSPANALHEAYYDGTFSVKYLGIAIPEEAKALRMVAGWATTTVDVLEERLIWNGWTSPELKDVYYDNALDSESSQIHLDSLIYGTSYISVTAGGDGEPEALIRGHDARNTVGIMNHRTRRLDVALTRSLNNEGNVDGLTLWLPHEIIELSREDKTNTLVVTDRVEHTLGRVPMVQQVNRPRTGDRGGKSEITRAVRSYTDSAVRALTGMEVNREFFSSPQRYMIGLGAEDMVDANGNRVDPWKILAGRIWGVPGIELEDENGELTGEIEKPEIGEFSPISPGPYLEQISGLARQLAAEAGLPAEYLGVTQSNPSSADAIVKGESRLIRRAEKRQSQFGHSWDDVGLLTQAVLGVEGERPRSMWMDPSTPTMAATTDAMVKATQAKLVPSGSEVVLRKLRFSEDEIRQIQREMALERSAMITSSIGNRNISEQAIRAAMTGEQ